MPSYRFREPVHKARHCDVCGNGYYRCNKYRAWTRQNTGSRTGWTLAVLSICTHCQPENVATRSMISAQTNIVRYGSERISRAS